MAELEIKPRPPIFQLRGLHHATHFGAFVIVNIEGRRAGLMFNLKWGQGRARHNEVWVETKMHLVGNSSLKSITALNYKTKSQ